MKALLFGVFCLFLVLVISSPTRAQQVIGSFPQMDGGFEYQTPFSSLSSTTSIPTGTVSTSWTIGISSGGVEAVTLNSSRARTGQKYATLGYPTGTQTKRYQSPTTADNTLLDSTYYTVQFYYRTKDNNPPLGLQGGVFLNGTVTGTNTYGSMSPLVGSPGGWQKATTTIKTGAVVASPRYGVGIIRLSLVGIDSLDLDDFVVYPITYPDTIDNTAPDSVTSASAGNPTNTTLEVSWSAPLSGVDGGGYVVLRYVADPTSEPAPNVNGIYQIGETIGNGTICYIGIATSFTDVGLTIDTRYYYRIYTVDKAFNYSIPAVVDGKTNMPILAAEPTVQTSNIQITDVSWSQMTISFTKGDGEKRIVLIHATSAVTANPSDGGTFAANSVFGTAGTQIGTGNYVVYNDTGTSVTVTGLSKLTRYYIQVYEYNGVPGMENYLTVSPASANITTTPGELISVQTGNWNATTTWNTGTIPTAQDNVTIASGMIVTVTATQDVYNLTTVEGGQLKSDLSLPTASTNLRYLRVYGATVVTDGVVGGSADALAFECRASVTFSGTGTLSPARVRPGNATTGITILFNQDMTLTYSGTDGLAGTALYTQSADGTSNNITILVAGGKTLTFANNANWYTNNDNSNGTANTTITIDGNVDLSGANSNFGVKITAGKSCTLTVNGLLTIGRNFNASSGTGGAVSSVVVGTTGNLDVRGTADFTEPIFAVTGGGTFTLASGATINIGSPDGISASGSTGNVQTGVRNFSKTALYHYVDGSVPQITGSGLPDSVASLIVSDTLVTLTKSVTIRDTLHLSTGDLELNGNVVTLGPVGYLREPAGHSLKGVTGGYITTTRLLETTSDTVNIAGLGLKIQTPVNLGSTIISRGHAVQAGASIKRYYDIQPEVNTGLNAKMIFPYTYTDLNGIPESTLVLFKSTDGGTIWSREGGLLDTSANTLALTGIESFSRWTLADKNGQVYTNKVISVNQGWNMISIPLTVADARKSVLFPTANSAAFRYSAGYQQADTLRNTIGYWLKFPAATEISLNGYGRYTDTVLVTAGWNMIGGISSIVPVETITCDPPGIVSSNFFGYKAGYQGVDTLLPGKAYWVKTDVGGKLILSTGQGSMSARISIKPTGELPPEPPREEVDNSSRVPDHFELSRNYPNPFNPSTKVNIAVPTQSHVEVAVYNLLGERIKTLLNGELPAGFHSVEWNGVSESNIPMPTGMYFIRMTNEQYTGIQKVMMIK